MRKYEYEHGRLVEDRHTQNIYMYAAKTISQDVELQGVYFDVVNGRLSYMKQCQDVAVQLWSNLA